MAEEVEESEEEEEDEDVNDVVAPVLSPSTEIPVSNHTSQSDGTLSVNVFTSAEELERAQRLEERERIIREIWRNGQPDILGTGTGTIGRVHYYWLVRLQGNAVNADRKPLRLECFTAYGGRSCQPLIRHWAWAELKAGDIALPVSRRCSWQWEIRRRGFWKTYLSKQNRSECAGQTARCLGTKTNNSGFMYVI